MKKYLLIAGLGLITAGGVAASVWNSGKKKAPKATKEDCMQKKQCSKSERTACY